MRYTVLRGLLIRGVYILLYIHAYIQLDNLTVHYTDYNIPFLESE